MVVNTEDGNSIGEGAVFLHAGGQSILAQPGHISVNRPLALRCLAFLRRGFALQFVGDSRILLEGFLGKLAVTNKAVVRSLRMAQEGLLRITRSFPVRAPSLQDFALAVPRADNSAADKAANQVLDSGGLRQIFVEESIRFLHHGGKHEDEELGLLISRPADLREHKQCKSICVVDVWWLENLFPSFWLRF